MIAIFAATQRMGSTLLQRIMNANPDTMIWGENGRVIQHQFDAMNENLRYESEQSGLRPGYFRKDRPHSIDVACLNPDRSIILQSASNALRTYLNTMYHSNRYQRFGFKEVQHSPQAVRWFIECFPDAKVILLIRNAVDSFSSIPSEWPATAESHAAMWMQNVPGYREIAGEFRNVHLFEFETMLMDKPRLLETAGITEKTLDEVLKYKTNSSTHDRPTKQIDQMKRYLKHK